MAVVLFLLGWALVSLPKSSSRIVLESIENATDAALALTGQINSCADNGRPCCICRADNGMWCGNPHNPSDPRVEVPAEEVPFQRMLHYTWNPTFKQEPPPRAWSKNLCCEWADDSWTQLGNAVGDDWFSDQCWGFSQHPCMVNERGMPVVRKDKSWTGLAGDVASQIAHNVIEFTTAQWDFFSKKFHDLARRMMQDPGGTLWELYSDMAKLFTVENLENAWKVVKGVGNIAMFVVAVSCPACGVGVFIWSLAKSMIDAIFMYAAGDSTGAILGKLSFDVITSGFLAGFGFDHNIVMNTLTENVWLGLDTLCTSLKLSADARSAVSALARTQTKTQLKDEDIVLSKESLDLIDETGQFASQLGSDVVQHKLTCKMIKLEAAQRKRGGQYEDECAGGGGPLVGEVSCSGGMTVELGERYPIDTKVMGIQTTDWMGSCKQCGMCLEQRGALSRGWYCEQDLFATGIWLKQNAPANWSPRRVPNELRLCKPLDAV